MQDGFVLFNGLLRVAQVLRRLHAGDVLLRVDGGQIHFGHFQVAIEVNGILEVLDRLLIVGAFIGLHAFVQLVAGPKFVATHGGQ